MREDQFDAAMSEFFSICDSAEENAGATLPEERFYMKPVFPQETQTPKPQTPVKEEHVYLTHTEVASAVSKCTRCPLAKTRKRTVPGEGSLNPAVLVVGEGPGADEDAQGRPFVGRAGQLLDQMLKAISLSRDDNCYITNIVKCRPPENRDPEPSEVAACREYLDSQIALLRPRAILCVGRHAARLLTGVEEGITKIHGRFYRYGKIPVIATYHPAALLRNPDLKRPAWEDLKKLAAFLDLPLIRR